MRRLSAFAAAAALAASVFMPSARNGAEPPARPKKLPDFALPDAGMTVRKRSEWESGKALVVVFTGTQCPQCNRFIPELAGIEKDYKSRGVAVIGINSNRNEQTEIAEHAREHEVPFPILRDADHALADELGIEVTPTALVADSNWVIRYRGRIDKTSMGSATTGEDVRVALDAVLAGQDVAKPETEPRGCTVRRNEPKKEGAVTWSKDVAPIVYANCVTCHRAGQIGPMPLTDFSHASAFAQEIRNSVSSKRMPPWKPVGGQEFVGERKLTQDQIDTILKWVDAGTPEGNEGEAPALPTFKSDWIMGEPDLVLDAGEDFEVKPGPDLYWHFIMPNKWDEDKWVSAVEVKPGNSRIVHHVLAYLDTTGTAKRLNDAGPGLGYEGGGAFPGFVPTGEMGGWTPGFFAKPLPKGVARKLPKDSTLVLQVHYNNSTRSVQKDRTKIGLYFAKEPVRQRLYQARILNPWFKIPAGEAAWDVNASWPVNRDITVISLMPHCHLLGRKAKMVAELPTGKTTSLIEIEDWDFKWQDTYNLKSPLHLPNSTTIRLTMTYDNSEDNLRNPHTPPIDIHWGEKTSDEMCLGYVNYVRDHEDLTKKKSPKK